MSAHKFSTNDLDKRSALQLTLWSMESALRTRIGAAFSAFGTADQRSDLELLGNDFVDYHQFASAELESRNYPGIPRLRISHSVMSEPLETGRVVMKRSARVLGAGSNGPVARGYGCNDHPNEVTFMFYHLISSDWRRLIETLGWDPDDLGTVNAPGVAFYPKPDPELSLLAPPAWA